MKIETQPLENHQIEITAEIEPDLVQHAMVEAARHLSRRVKIPGFRPGRAPYQVVLRQLGEPAVFEDALEHLIDEVYPKVIEESKVKTYGNGSLEKIESRDPLVLKFSVALAPEVVLGDYHSIRREYHLEPVTENEVERVLQDLREHQAVQEPVTRPAEMGDIVTVRLSAKRLQPEPEQDPSLVRERSTPILIRPEEDPVDDELDKEWPFPGFSRNLVGLVENDQKSIAYQFPEDSNFPSLRGVNAEFNLVVESIKARILPELNDDFAISQGEYTNLEELRAGIRKELEQRAEAEHNRDFDEAVLDEVVEQSDFKYAPQLVDDEYEDFLSGMKSRLKSQNLDFETYLKIRNTDLEAFKKDNLPDVEKGLKKKLALAEVATRENIEIQPTELQSEVSRTMDSLGRVLNERDARRLSDERVYTRLVGNVLEDMLVVRASEKLRSIARGTAEIAKKASEEPVEETAGTVAEIAGAETEENPGIESESEETPGELPKNE